MLRTNLFASPATKSNIYIRNQTTHHLFQGKYPYLLNSLLKIHVTKNYLKNLHKFIKKLEINWDITTNLHIKILKTTKTKRPNNIKEK